MRPNCLNLLLAMVAVLAAPRFTCADENPSAKSQKRQSASSSAIQSKAIPVSNEQRTTSLESDAAGAAGKKPQLSTGQVLRRTYDFAEAQKEMEYRLYIPNKYDSAQPAPLIVALHGLYSNPKQILGYPGFTKKAEQHGYILVAPMGYNNRGWYGSLGSGGGRGDDPKNLGELSEKDVMNVLRIVRQQLNVDDSRIYLLGHSMGGGGTLHLASRYPDVWAAIAPIAPAFYGSYKRLEPAKGIPAIIVQGAKDRLVPVTGTRRLVKSLEEMEAKLRYIEIEDGGHLAVGWSHFDDIFKFFAQQSKHAEKAAEKSNAE